MKRRNRDIAIFTLSALDVLAMGAGVFVLLVVLLMPYYRMNLDARAEVEAVEASIEEVRSEAEEIRRASAARSAAAESAAAEAARLEQAAAARQAAAASLLDEATSAEDAAERASRKIAEMEAIIEKRLIRELDLVFVVDTTSSMTRSLQDLSESLSGIVSVLQRLVSSLRVGFVAYRDHDVGGWVTRRLPPAPVATRARDIYAFAESLREPVRGGSTPTEALYDGLREAFALDYRADAKTVIVVIGDAASHRSVQTETLAMTRRFVESGAKRSVSALFVTTASFLRYGDNDREFFQEIARRGGGQFTDKQGRMTEGILLSVLDDPLASNSSLSKR